MLSAALKKLLLEAMLLLSPGLYAWISRGPVGSPRRPSQLPGLGSRVLVVDHDFPLGDRDAGSRAITGFVDLLLAGGAEVVFWVASRDASADGRNRLSRLGVEVIDRAMSGPFDDWIAAQSHGFSACVLSRPLIAAMHVEAVRRHVDGPCIYYGHDIHHRRIEAMQRVSGHSAGAIWQRWFTRIVERRLWRRADVVLYPSVEEADIVNDYRSKLGLKPNAETFPLWTFAEDETPPAVQPAERSGLLFVGSYAHAPNVDALNWFMEEIAPHLARAWPQIVLTVVGSGMEAYRPHVMPVIGLNMRGWIDDAELTEAYARTRLVVAPLRYGAGVKGKVLEAAGMGVPCVLTPCAAQGLQGIGSFFPVEANAYGFAIAVMQLLADDAAWHHAAVGARDLVASRYNRVEFVERVRALVGATNSLPEVPIHFS